MLFLIISILLIISIGLFLLYIPFIIKTKIPFIDDSLYLQRNSFDSNITIPILKTIHSNKWSKTIKCFFVSYIRKFSQLYGKYENPNVKTGNIFISPNDPNSYILLQCLNLLFDKYPDLILQLVIIEARSDDSITSDINDTTQFSNLYNDDNCKINEPNNKIDINSKEWNNKLEKITRVLICIQKSNKHNLIKGNSDATSKMLKDSLKSMNYLWNNNNNDIKDDELNIIMKDKFESIINYDIIRTILKDNSIFLCNYGYYKPGLVEIEGEFYQFNKINNLVRY
jgi:hypothetical protein